MELTRGWAGLTVTLSVSGHILIRSLSVDSSGVRQGDLVNWYLKEVEHDIESLEELAEKKVLVEKVIDRLVNHVSITPVRGGVHYTSQHK